MYCKILLFVIDGGVQVNFILVLERVRVIIFFGCFGIRGLGVVVVMIVVVGFGVVVGVGVVVGIRFFV